MIHRENENMTPDQDRQRKALTDQVNNILIEQTGRTRARMAERYMEQCFRRVPTEDLLSESPQDLAAIITGQLDFIRRREAGEPCIVLQ